VSTLQRIEKTGSLTNLAAEINAEHRAFIGSLKKTAEHGIRAGELLSKAKGEVKHGQWLGWLEENFEGSVRSAQVYMQLFAKRDELRVNAQGSAHLSISGALREVAAPTTDERQEPEEDAGGAAESDHIDVSLIRETAEAFLQISPEEREVLERILANPGLLERNLLDELMGAEIMLLAQQVSVDGFLMEDAAEEGQKLISYRAPLGAPAEAKEKIVKVPIPATKAVDEDADLAGCIMRGCWQLGLVRLKAWRSVTNWFATALAADAETDIELWEKRVAHNADWRQIDVATEFLDRRALHPELNPAQWVKEHGLKPSEFKVALELAQWMTRDHAERVWRYITGKSSRRQERYERWLSFESREKEAT
jgi:hypothetical protein